MSILDIWGDWIVASEKDAHGIYEEFGLEVKCMRPAGSCKALQSMILKKKNPAPASDEEVEKCSHQVRVVSYEPLQNT